MVAPILRGGWQRWELGGEEREKLLPSFLRLNWGIWSEGRGMGGVGNEKIGAVWDVGARGLWKYFFHYLVLSLVSNFVEIPTSFIWPSRVGLFKSYIRMTLDRDKSSLISMSCVRNGGRKMEQQSKAREGLEK
jgi:hypothetical protein